MPIYKCTLVEDESKEHSTPDDPVPYITKYTASGDNVAEVLHRCFRHFWRPAEVLADLICYLDDDGSIQQKAEQRLQEYERETPAADRDSWAYTERVARAKLTIGLVNIARALDFCITEASERDNAAWMRHVAASQIPDVSEPDENDD